MVRHIDAVRSRVGAVVPAFAAAGAAVDQLFRGSVRNAQTATAVITRDRAQRQELTAVEPGGEGSFLRLDAEECRALLATRSFGRLAYIARAGVPDIVPVNYGQLAGDILIRTGPGPKLHAADRKEMVAFQVDDLDEDTRTGWSVVVAGRATRVRAAELAAMDPGALPETWAPGDRHVVMRIRPRRIEGRRLTAS